MSDSIYYEKYTTNVRFRAEAEDEIGRDREANQKTSNHHAASFTPDIDQDVRGRNIRNIGFQTNHDWMAGI